MACGLLGRMCNQNGEGIDNVDTPSLTMGAGRSGPITISIADATLAVPQDRAALTTPRSRFHDSGDPNSPA